MYQNVMRISLIMRCYLVKGAKHFLGDGHRTTGIRGGGVDGKHHCSDLGIVGIAGTVLAAGYFAYRGRRN